MTPQEFKSALKSIESQLREMNIIQLITPSGQTPFRSVREFGYAVLEAEKGNNYFYPTRVWTKSSECFEVEGFSELIKMLESNNIASVGFRADWRCDDFAECLKMSGGLD